jgi:hypothetical protein
VAENQPIRTLLHGRLSPAVLQSAAAYAMNGPEVEVSLLSVDGSNRLRRVSTRWVRKQEP